MRAILVLGTAALALSACQSAEEKHAAETGEIEVTNAPTAQVAKLLKAAAPKTAARPGLWKAALRIESVDVGPGSDNAAQLAMAKKLERDATECKTAEQLKPFDISKLEKAAGECTFVRYVAKGGKVDAEIRCKKPNGPITELRINGTSAPTGFDVGIETRTGTAGKPGFSLVRMRSTGARLGECAGTAG
ncbi:hypothetical protein FHS95_001629 [Sphingomonas naasensis]|uniref:DUF3617 family protein n=1 Tax=Sphingomonas naasensis TaxID=1344951 RepID=A0A4S1W9D2_9SPHN|nr:DUF3617 family protein [Sphingomonas naasensis]NIJ19960.1 hypothetical protein [Sphingomonas naasensis]TGX37917.1 DUF3617 family protein [Sphingomonas naasensis]